MFSKKVALIAAIAVVAIVGTVCVFNPEAVGFRFRFVPHFKGPVEHSWTAWKAEHNKTYGGPEDKARFAVYKNNHRIVQEHNAKEKNYTLALNQFADLTNKEFGALYTGASAAFKDGNACPPPSMLVRLNAPDTLDWRTKGVVSDVKNQQQCGSCWAFSTTGSLEGLYAKQTGSIQTFSEQELVDCTTGYGNFGCGGGWVQNAFKYVLEKGIASEDSYPYTATDEKCQDLTIKSVYTPKGCANVQTNSVDALRQALQTGPVSIYIEADQSTFQLYANGTLDDPSCFVEGQIDHAVLAVGYTADAWIVKNSWGAGWGKDGYIYIATENSKDARGVCGILSTPNTYPL